MQNYARFFRRTTTSLVLALTSLLLTGCFLDGQRRSRYNASVVDYLYPGGRPAPVVESIPTLSLPLKVGIAFVPPKQPERYARIDGEISESRKLALLESVADRFRSHKFVKEIEVIPATYLREGGSFDNLDQVAKLFGVDVIALVSYDQLQFTDQDAVSLVYWTIAGAYLIPGEKNDTQTMIDAVVYDVPSRSLLFRAPGVSRTQGRSTPVNVTEELRIDAEDGFRQAATNLVENLQIQLTAFQEKVKNRPNDFKIVSRPGHTGSGSLGLPEALLALAAFTAVMGIRGSKSKP